MRGEIRINYNIKIKVCFDLLQVLYILVMKVVSFMFNSVD